MSVSSVMRFHVGGAAEVEFLTTFVSLHVLISELFSTQRQLTLCRTVSSKNKIIHFSDIICVCICTNVCCFLGLPGISITLYQSICCWDTNVSTVLILDECYLENRLNLSSVTSVMA